MSRLCLALSFSISLLAQPVITEVLDGAAYTPNIAQGSIFIVKGTNLSPAGLVRATAPTFPTTLNNIRITFTPATTAPALSALMIYTFNQAGTNQLAAVLPSNAPIGTHEVRVINGTQISEPFRVTVVARKPGIITVSGDGTGPAQATINGAFILQRPTIQGRLGDFDTRPARPGERIDLWGTGLGPDPASDNGGTSGNQTASAQVRVLLNGQEITPLYAGRSQGLPGLDQIVFNLPTTVAQNCNVMVQVRTGDILSNPVTISTSATNSCNQEMTIRINEVESNGGTPGDWVELFNPGPNPVNLAGYIFKDNDDTRTFALPATATVPPGGYLTLEEADFNFGLGAADSARLFTPDGTLVESYEWTTHAAITYGRCPNSTGPLTNNFVSTKNATNNCGSPIRINEIESDGGTPSDWIELINPTATPIDVSGFLLRNSTNTASQTIPTNTTVPANGYLAIDTTFPLEAADSARLFDRSSTLVDSYSWTTHAPTTFGRCPNGTGAFTTTNATSKGTPNVCPGDVTFLQWPGSQSVTVVDPPNSFNGNLSGLVYADPTTLWAVRNGPGSLFILRFDGTLFRPDAITIPLRYTNGTGDVDGEGIVLVNNQLFVAAERDNSNNAVSRNSILRYNPTTTATPLSATQEWNLTSDLPTTQPNVGLEAITWVPDTYLTSRNFIDESRNRPYNPADYPDHGTGLFIVGLESNGILYAYALNQTNNTFTRIATISTGLAAVMDIHFDPDQNDLWALCDNTCNGRMSVLRIDSTGKFTTTLRFERPAQMPNLNNEGFTIAPLSTCTSGQRSVLFADDGETAGNAIRASSLPCTRLP